MSDMRIKTCVLGQVSTNCYLVYRESEKKAVIVDPADNASYILNKCRELGITPEAILLTHGHFDHIMAVEDIHRAFRVRIYAGELEKPLLENPAVNLSGSYGDPKSVRADVFVKEGDVLDLIGYKWRVIGTPGHTAGSVCYWIEEEKVLLSGDTLFAESLGRTDLPTGSSRQIVDSIVDKLFKLPEDTMVYTGHGDPTTIRHEKKYNPVANLGGDL